jgi:hypothetical protein
MTNNLVNYQLALEIVNASSEKLAIWAGYIEIGYDEDAQDECYFWADNTPEEAKKLDPYDVLSEHWRR